MSTEQVTLILDTAKANVRAVWEQHGFVPTTDGDRAAMQKKNAHVPQCRCKFCQMVTA